MEGKLINVFFKYLLFVLGSILMSIMLIYLPLYFNLDYALAWTSDMSTQEYLLIKLLPDSIDLLWIGLFYSVLYLKNDIFIKITVFAFVNLFVSVFVEVASFGSFFFSIVILVFSFKREEIKCYHLVLGEIVILIFSGLNFMKFLMIIESNSAYRSESSENFTNLMLVVWLIISLLPIILYHNNKYRNNFRIINKKSIS